MLILNNRRCFRFCPTAVALTSACGIVFTVAPAAHAQETVGNALISRTTYDNATSGLYVMTNSGFSAPGTVATWGFFDNVQTTNFQITPVIFQLVGDTYTVTGVGTTRTNTGGGAQTFTFSTASGSAAVGPNFFFGWRDGAASGNTNNSGVPAFDNTGPGTIRWFNSVDATVGSTPGAVTDYTRTYSLQANTSAGTAPEPGSVLLLTLGGASVAPAFRRVRRRKRSAV